ncbi:unnamed protein product, partial [Prorocentrum cordatum]
MRPLRHFRRLLAPVLRPRGLASPRLPPSLPLDRRSLVGTIPKGSALFGFFSASASQPLYRVDGDAVFLGGPCGVASALERAAVEQGGVSEEVLHAPGVEGMHALLGFSGARNEAVGADMHANRAAVAAVRAASEDQDWALPKWFSWPDVQAFLVAPGLEGDPEEAARGIAQLMDQIAHRDAGHEFPLVQPSELGVEVSLMSLIGSMSIFFALDAVWHFVGGEARRCPISQNTAAAPRLAFAQ